MKRTILITIMLAVFGVIIITGFATPASCKTVVIKWAAYQTPASPFTISQRYFANEIERVSQGAVEVKFFWSQSLVGAKEMMEAVRDRVADVVSISASYFRSKVPLTSIVDVPFLNPKGQGGKEGLVYNRAYTKPMFVEEHEKWNSVFLYFGYAPPYNLMGKVPIKNVEDLNGKRIRAMGSLGTLLKSFGAVPVFTSAPETFASLDKGVMDLAAGPGDYWMDAYKVYEASDYYTIDMDMGANGNIVLMNKDIYSKLPEEVKKAIPMIRDKTAYVSQEAMASPEKLQHYREKYKSSGIEIIHFPPEEREKLVRKAEEYWEQWVKKWEGEGVKNSREAMDTIKNLIKSVEKEFPGEQLDVPKDLKAQVAQLEKEAKSGK
jgi:TRAP-type C4-dicarboxylate transport system substrate-binding protein